MMHDLSRLQLLGDKEIESSIQTCPLAKWPDGSVKWGLLDFQVSMEPFTTSIFRLAADRKPLAGTSTPSIKVLQRDNDLQIDTKAAVFQVDRQRLKPLSNVNVDGLDMLENPGSEILVEDASGNILEPVIETECLETTGSLRTTWKAEGKFQSHTPGKLQPLRFLIRLHFFANHSFLRIDFNVWNPNAALHQGGLWDLGDPNSIYIRFLGLKMPLLSTDSPAFKLGVWEDADCSGDPMARLNERNCELDSTGSILIFQDSSGGDNWQSINHVDRNREITPSFQGYRIHSDNQEVLAGRRANPVIALESGNRAVCGAFNYFWQEFPKSMHVSQNKLTLGLFSREHKVPMELQPGESKTYNLYFDFRKGSTTPKNLLWAYRPLVAAVSPSWHERAGAIPFLVPASRDSNSDLLQFIESAISGERSFFNRREEIDQYGWRNFGELYADHESIGAGATEHFPSHYNNQYDVLAGTLYRFAATADPRWFILAHQLCRHIRNIDIYNTLDDIAFYSKGLFWHTNHHLPAETASHRCYSSRHLQIIPNPRAYGGGPSLSHLYTSGLLLHYYMTGEPATREAMVSLAQYAAANAALYGTVCHSAVGVLSKVAKRLRGGIFSKSSKQTALEIYELDGPSRASGNLLNALLDAYELTGDRVFLRRGEKIIGKCISRHDDIDSRQLLKAEYRWMYTIFLQALAKYLLFKPAEANNHTHENAYHAFLHYISWMASNERFYLDYPNELDYPTETWAAQEIRKSNLLFLGSLFKHEQRRLFIQKADSFRLQMISRLQSFANPQWTRPIAIILQNLNINSWFLHQRADESDILNKTWKEHPPTADGGPHRLGYKNSRLHDEMHYLRTRIPFADKCLRKITLRRTGADPY
jgi:hypothetical protein